MRVVAAGLIAAIFLAGCQPTCSSTCTRFYAETECGAGPEGLPTEDAIQECVAICQEAVTLPGPEVVENDRRFNPDFTAPLDQSHTLDDEREASAWMDCVWSFTDEECHDRLDAQYCAKIF
jgi:hypothetical protein